MPAAHVAAIGMTSRGNQILPITSADDTSEYDAVFIADAKACQRTRPVHANVR